MPILTKRINLILATLKHLNDGSGIYWSLGAFRFIRTYNRGGQAQ